MGVDILAIERKVEKGDRSREKSLHLWVLGQILVACDLVETTGMRNTSLEGAVQGKIVEIEEVVTEILSGKGEEVTLEMTTVVVLEEIRDQLLAGSSSIFYKIMQIVAMLHAPKPIFQ
jgi:hypothetical protein